MKQLQSTNLTGTTVADPAPDLSDEQLLRSFVECNDRDSFERIVRRYQVEIYNYLRRYLGDEALAEDAFQLTFVKLYEKAAQFDLNRRFRPWLYSVATNQAIDLQRKVNRRSVQSLDLVSQTEQSRGTTHAAAIPDHRQAEEDVLVVAEFESNMRSAVEQVGEPGRSALELVYLQGLSYKDAAEALDVPVGTVKSRVHSAIRKLAQIWNRTK